MEKKTNNLMRLLPYYKKYTILCVAVIILSLGYAGISLLSPIYEGKMLGFFEEFNQNKIIKTALLLFIIRIVIEIVTNAWSRIVLKLNSKVNLDLKKNLLESFTNFEIKNFDHTNSGLFISRLNKDTTELAELFDFITDDLSGIILGVSFIIYVFFLNIYLGIFLILNLLIISLLVSKKISVYKKVRKNYKEKDENLIGLYTDIVRGIREVKSLNLKSVFLNNINHQQEDTIQAEMKSIDTRRTWNRWIAAVQHFLDFIYILLSIYFIKHQSLTVASFLIIFLYKNKILIFLDCISELREKIADGKISATRVFDMMDYQSFSKEQFGNQSIEYLNGKIEFQNVSFCYENELLFENLNFGIEPNQMVAIVGKSGEGKSTILKLMHKSYSVDKGKILLDGIDINKLSEKSIKNNIAIVLQSPYIFNLSIKENIRLSKMNATDEEIIEVCKKAQIHDDIMKLENGYDTLVGENGVILSGGQKQRLAIARALMKQSKIILLDEATSSLDNENQEKIKHVMRDLSKDHTVIIVAHRLSTIVNADKILYLDHHSIVASGTHQYLMEHCSEYKKLYEIEE